MIINVHTSSCKVPIIDRFICFFEYSNVNFHENPSRGRQDVPCGWTETDRQDEANSHFSQFFESA
jgi:hypothetical protein